MIIKKIIIVLFGIYSKKLKTTINNKITLEKLSKKI